MLTELGSWLDGDWEAPAPGSRFSILKKPP